MEALNDHFLELSYSGLGSRVLFKGSMEVSGFGNLCTDAMGVLVWLGMVTFKVVFA
jgi:hypothetical protein